MPFLFSSLNSNPTKTFSSLWPSLSHKINRWRTSCHRFRCKWTRSEFWFLQRSLARVSSNPRRTQCSTRNSSHLGTRFKDKYKDSYRQIQIEIQIQRLTQRQMPTQIQIQWRIQRQRQRWAAVLRPGATHALRVNRAKKCQRCVLTIFVPFVFI